eukprot:4749623-Prymnesium_polylepis.3
MAVMNSDARVGQRTASNARVRRRGSAASDGACPADAPDHRNPLAAAPDPNQASLSPPFRPCPVPHLESLP